MDCEPRRTKSDSEWPVTAATTRRCRTSCSHKSTRRCAVISHDVIYSFREFAGRAVPNGVVGPECADRWFQCLEPPEAMQQATRIDKLIRIIAVVQKLTSLGCILVYEYGNSGYSLTAEII